VNDLASAADERYRAMLERAIADLDRELESFSTFDSRSRPL
jgi:hypothetical protein